MRTQQGTRKVFWVRHHVLLKPETTKTKVKIQICCCTLVELWWLCNSWQLKRSKLVWIAWKSVTNIVITTCVLIKQALCCFTETVPRRKERQRGFRNFAGWHRMEFFSINWDVPGADPAPHVHQIDKGNKTVLKIVCLYNTTVLPGLCPCVQTSQAAKPY